MTKISKIRIAGPFDCYFNCGAVLISKNNRADIGGWTWFTEYGEHTVHICEQCQRQHSVAVAALKEDLSIKPDNYPKVFAVSRQRKICND